MAAKQLDIRREQARQAILRGVQKLSKAVGRHARVPRARNVVIDRNSAPPKTITKDGVTVAKGNRTGRDPYENMGAPDGPRSRQQNQRHRPGDGTTTATVLAESIYREG